MNVPFIFNETVSTAEEIHSRIVQENDHRVSLGKVLLGRDYGHTCGTATYFTYGLPKIIQNLGQDSQKSWRHSNCVSRKYKFRQRYYYVNMLAEHLVATCKVYEGQKS